MFIYYILTSGYNWFIDLLMGNNKSVKDKKYTDKDVIIQMIILGVVLILTYLSAYYMPYAVLILMSMSK